jgi:hypothetical protein
MKMKIKIFVVLSLIAVIAYTGCAKSNPGTTGPAPTATITPVPSFGNDTASPDLYLNANQIALGLYHNANTVTLTGIKMQCGSTGAHITAGIYNSSGNIVAQSASTTCVSGWNTLNITPNVSLSPGDYYIGGVSDTLYGLMCTNGGTMPVYNGFTYGPLLSTIAAFGTGSASGFSMLAEAICIY